MTAEHAPDLLAVAPDYKLTPEREAAAMARIAGRQSEIEVMVPKLVDANGKLDETKLKAVFEPGFSDIPKTFKGKAPTDLAAELQKPEYATFISTFKKRADALP
jgi:hypothetical protein